jgi:hypothetical protein
LIGGGFSNSLSNDKNVLFTNLFHIRKKNKKRHVSIRPVKFFYPRLAIYKFFIFDQPKCLCLFPICSSSSTSSLICALFDISSFNLYLSRGLTHVKTPQKPFVYSLTLKNRRKKYLPSIPLNLLSNSVAGFLQTMMQNHIEKSVDGRQAFLLSSYLASRKVGWGTVRQSVFEITLTFFVYIYLIDHITIIIFCSTNIAPLFLSIENNTKKQNIPN